METLKQNVLKPTFGSSFGHGWESMKNYFLILLLVVIVTSLVMAPMQIGNLNMDVADFNWDEFDMSWFNPGIAMVGIMAFIVGMIALAYTLLVVPIIKYGGDFMFVKAVRDIRPEFETLIIGFKENYLYIVLANLLTGALIMLGFIFLFFPGIIVACRLVFVSYLVMDKKLDPIQAVEESWKLTRGHGWTVFFMGFVSFFLAIAGLALLFVGIIPAIMWIKSSFASLYQAVLQEKEALPQVA